MTDYVAYVAFHIIISFDGGLLEDVTLPKAVTFFEDNMANSCVSRTFVRQLQFCNDSFYGCGDFSRLDGVFFVLRADFAWLSGDFSDPNGDFKRLGADVDCDIFLAHRSSHLNFLSSKEKKVNNLSLSGKVAKSQERIHDFRGGINN